MTVGGTQTPPRVGTGDRDAVLRQIRWCAAVQTLVNCQRKLEENPVGNVERVLLVVQYLTQATGMFVCVVREGQKSPGNRRRRQHDKSSESSSHSPSVVNHNAVNSSSDKENFELDGHTDDVDTGYDDEMEVADVKTDREIRELSKMTDSGAAQVLGTVCLLLFSSSR